MGEASSGAPEGANEETNVCVDREHSCWGCVFISCCLSMCITVDILQYSMPLAFLPSVLEDRGHSPLHIATAIGVYYWTGFAGGLMITSFKIYQLVGAHKPKLDSAGLAATRRQVQYLIVGLLVGSATLAVQAMYPRWAVHTVCRFIQGFAGAFIFFYTFLLAVALFQGRQQVFAMTAASAALNVAEVLGSSVGAWLFHTWGQSSVFWFLGVASLVNQLMLLAVLRFLRPGRSPAAAAAKAESPGGWRKLLAVLKSRRLGCAVLLIAAAATVKGAVEEMLPFHADHRWGLSPIEIGELFSVIAVGYIASAALAGQLWDWLHSCKVTFSACWLVMLGGMALIVFEIANYYKNQKVLMVGLLLYGTCLGLTHTPAALLLADAIEAEPDGQAKDAVNGIWNTMWEAGGSLGFLLGGLLAEDYSGQRQLLRGLSVCCVLCAAAMVALDRAPPEAGLKAVAQLRTSYGSSA
mmetsp:Transcript_57023/g.183273  ORF Transcript_57023/g.183273 Transcript_57023/m.183273 type:complete len:466 (+) Transcript_57023:131-1528(+)